jgi:hypothetical protein
LSPAKSKRFRPQECEGDRFPTPSTVSVIDLSDTDSTLVNNLVIAKILHGLQVAQDSAYESAEKEGRAPTPVMVIIEEVTNFCPGIASRKWRTYSSR